MRHSSSTGTCCIARSRTRGAHGYRRALVNHYMSAESLLPWQNAEGRHSAEYDFRDIVSVAGEDPYAYKGLRDLSVPGSRADKSGGCDR